MFLFKTGHWRTSTAQSHSSSSLETYPSLIMDGSRVSDFSIERILSPQLGHKPPLMELSPDGYLRGIPGGFCLDSGSLRPPAPVPVPVPVPGCLQYQGMSYGEAFYPYGAGFHHSDFSSIYPNSGVFVHFSRQDSAGAFSQTHHRRLIVVLYSSSYLFRFLDFKKKFHQFMCKLVGTFWI